MKGKAQNKGLFSIAVQSIDLEITSTEAGIDPKHFYVASNTVPVSLVTFQNVL